MSDPASETAENADAALAALVQQAAAGNQRAVDDLLSRFRSRLKRMVHLRLSRRLQGRVDDSDDVGEFNRDWERYYATVSVDDVVAKDVGVSVTVDFWDDDDRDTSSFGADFSYTPEKRWDASIGTYYSLYKYRFLEFDETDDVRTYYARWGYDLSEQLKLDALYEYENDDLDVPDYTRAGLTMSGVALTAESAKSGITIRPFDPLREELPGPITAIREFQAGDRLSVYAEVYESLQNAAEHVIDMKIELRTDAGRVIATTREERSSKELAGAGGHGFLAQVPLEDAAPGLYVIHVEASANAGDRPTASRDILIRVL